MTRHTYSTRYFTGFNHLINNSNNRNEWFDFRQIKTEYYIYQEIINNDKHIKKNEQIKY